MIQFDQDIVREKTSLNKLQDYELPNARQSVRLDSSTNRSSRKLVFQEFKNEEKEEGEVQEEEDSSREAAQQEVSRDKMVGLDDYTLELQEQVESLTTQNDLYEFNEVD